MNTQKQIFLMIVLSFMLVGACAGYAAFDLPIRAKVQEEYQFEESVRRGALLYANNCRTCHGNAGEGFVGPALNRPELRDQDPIVLRENRAWLTHTIQCGRAGTLMPAWLKEYGGSLTERQIEHIVNLITAPEEPGYEINGQPTSKGWVEALEFAHNLNEELTAVVGGDTLVTIAKQHRIGIRELAELNGVPLDQVDEFLPKGTEVRLPPTQQEPEGYIYKTRTERESISKIAETQYVGAIILAELNGIPYRIDREKGEFTIFDENGNPLPGLFPGQELELPEGAVYATVPDETLEEIAAKHDLSVEEIVALNREALADVEPTDPLPGDLVLALPKVERYVVQGQTLADVAQGFGRVTAATLAEANGIDDPNAVVAIGSQLKLPEESTGTAPPDSINPGTACVRYAVPESVYQTLPGVGTPEATGPEVEVPEAFSEEVEIHATAQTPDFEWTVVADGEELEPNKGAVKVRPGTEVRFVNRDPGLHTVTVNGEKVAEDLTAQGDVRTYTFQEVGDYKITCDYHPAMLAWVFVREE